MLFYKAEHIMAVMASATEICWSVRFPIPWYHIAKVQFILQMLHPQVAAFVAQ